MDNAPLGLARQGRGARLSAPALRQPHGWVSRRRRSRAVSLSTPELAVLRQWGERLPMTYLASGSSLADSLPRTSDPLRLDPHVAMPDRASRQRRLRDVRTTRTHPARRTAIGGAPVPRRGWGGSPGRGGSSDRSTVRPEARSRAGTRPHGHFRRRSRAERRVERHQVPDARTPGRPEDRVVDGVPRASPSFSTRPQTRRT